MAELPRSLSLSSSAFARLTALRRAEILGAQGMLRRADDGDDYPDFFVEGSGPPWHEAFEDVITGEVMRTEAQFSADRMAFVDRIRADGDGYDDFFVENGGDGNPWHEAFADAVGDSIRLVGDARARAAALARLNVVQSYLRLRGETLGR